LASFCFSQFAGFFGFYSHSFCVPCLLNGESNVQHEIQLNSSIHCFSGGSPPPKLAPPAQGTVGTAMVALAGTEEN